MKRDYILEDIVYKFLKLLLFAFIIYLFFNYKV